MRRVLGLLAVMVTIQLAAGCRHVAGGCDCDHAPGAQGTIAVGGAPAAAPAVEAAKPAK